MPQDQDRINGAGLFSAALRAIRGEISEEEVRASISRLTAEAQRRPEISEVYPARLGVASIKIYPDWTTEKVRARPGLFDGACPVCDGRGYYIPRGEHADRVCRCRELGRVISNVERVGVPAYLSRATPAETNWNLWERGLFGEIMARCKEISRRRHPHEEGARTVILEGPTGAGKSHLAALIALYAAAEGRSVRWVYWPDLFKIIREEFSSRRAGAGIAAVYHRLIKPYDVVILDDLGAGRAPEWAGDVWDDIVGRRASMKRTFIITTNYRREQIVPIAGARAASRLYGHADTITINAPDQRQEVQ